MRDIRVHVGVQKGHQVDLVEQPLERNVAGYISGLSLPSVTEETIALALTDVELRRAHQLGRG